MKINLRLLLILLCFFLANSTFAQTSRITGTVRATESNQPLTGVSVSVKGKNTGTVTNTEGNFELKTSIPATVFVLISGGFLLPFFSSGLWWRFWEVLEMRFWFFQFRFLSL